LKTSPRICIPPAGFVSSFYQTSSEALTSRFERREESTIDLLSTVNSQSINAIRRDQVCNPSLESAQHIGIFRPQVWERDGVISFPADFDTSCIVVVDETERMEVRFLVIH